ncbi:MAG: response regulator [Candidatus Eremiobacterota bacterium]
MKILVVDDDFLILDVIQEFLTIENFNVITTLSPLEALKIASSDRPDCILADVVMPEMNGYELYREIMKCYPDIKFIFVSGNVNEYDIKRELDIDVPLIKKPFTRKEIIYMIKNGHQSASGKGQPGVY